MRKTILLSAVLAICTCLTGCKANKTNSQSENISMTTETVTKSDTVIDNTF